MRNIVIFGLGCIGFILLAAWWMLFSRVSWRLRFVVVAAVLVTSGMLTAAIRFRGVTGDFIPILEPRWVSETVAPPPRAESAADLDKSGRADFPQYLGPNRDCVIKDGPVLARDWVKEPPQVLWRQPIGIGWSGFAVVGNRAITLEQRGDQETVTCLDIRTGREIWAHADPVRFDSSFGGDGPRSTPTIAEGRVFTYGGTGLLTCLKLETGEKLWQRNLFEEARGGRPEWGYAGSPLVLDGKVIISAGKSHEKSLWAYQVNDGKVAWRNGSQPGSYSSAMVTTLAGTRQILMFNMIAITAHDAETGAVLWEYPWGIRQPHVAQPVPVGPNRVIFSSGYGVGSELLDIQRDAEGKFSATRIWKSLNFRAKMASFIQRDGFLYGLDDGILACIDSRDAARKWKEGRYGHGQILLVGDLLLVTAENGEIILLAPTPEAANELTRFRVFDHKTWNPPAISDDLLLMRTDKEAVCLRLPVAKRP
ncbi:MAG: PQQ-binding-like beta-propeller repeat protein [Chthoniobacteraceae bacterium]